MKFNFDVIFIGAGPGGYVGAIRAAQLGLKTAVVEKNKTFGGTCLNVGCIPSKALLESSEYFHWAQHESNSHGIKMKPELDLITMMNRKDKIVKDLTQGISFLFKKNKIETFYGIGKVLQTELVEVATEGGEKILLNTKNIVLATGSVPIELPFLKFDERKIVSSTGALALSKIPRNLIVVGGGVIGLELGSVWLRLGSKVKVIEFADRICSLMDSQIISILQKSLTKQGMEFLSSTKVTGGKIVKSTADDEIELECENLKTASTSKIRGDVILVATGRKPFSEGLGLKELGLEMDARGFVKIDKQWRTNIPGIYAIGDLVPGPMLAHKAEEEGVAVAEIISGQAGHVNYHTVPGVIYTSPEVASVGYTEEEAKQLNIPYAVGTFPFLANGRAKALGFTEGMVKIITDSRSDKIIGGHIIGPRASELLGEIVIAMEFGGSSEDLARSFHAHPTLNEAIREAALAVSKRQRQM